MHMENLNREFSSEGSGERGPRCSPSRGSYARPFLRRLIRSDERGYIRSCSSNRLRKAKGLEREKRRGLSQGPSENFRGQFETLAARAAASLNRKTPADISLRDFWLDNLLSYLRKNSSNQLFGLGETGAGIRNICEASAIFCSYLEQNALEAERRANASIGKRKKSIRRATSAASPKRSKRRRAAGLDELNKNFRDEAWLKAQLSLNQKQAGFALGLSDRSIRALVKDHKLHKTPKSRIAVDGPFWSEFHKRHSVPH